MRADKPGATCDQNSFHTAQYKRSTNVPERNFRHWRTCHRDLDKNFSRRNIAGTLTEHELFVPSMFRQCQRRCEREFLSRTCAAPGRIAPPGAFARRVAS
jgi:hypothetical protein